MFGIDKVEYDNTDANTKAASDTIGAFVKAGTDGDEIGSQTQNAEEWLNTASILHDTTGTPLGVTSGSLDVNITNSLNLDVNLDGVYSGGNTDPDNVGAIFHVRNATPADTHQTFRSTGAKPDADDLDESTIYALDTNSFGYAWDGAAWDRLTSSSGNLDVNLASTDIALAVSDVANIAIANQAIAPDNVSEIEVKSGASILADRKYLWVQNLGPREIYLGKTGVSSANGIRLGRNALAEFRLGPSVSLFTIGTNASAEDVRVMAAS